MSNQNLQHPGSCQLLPGQWEPSVQQGLEAMIGEYGKSSSQYSIHRPPIAAFDWDNTCIAGDIGEGTLLQLAEETGDDLVARYIDLCTNEGLEAGYRYCAAILGGGTAQDIYDLTHRALKTHLIQGTITYRPAIYDLIKNLTIQGWEVWIVTAAQQQVVQAAAMAFNIKPERVIGMQLEPGPDSTLLQQCIEPFTMNEGKVTALLERAGQNAIFAAGDSDTDLALLQSATHGLVIDRGQPGLLQSAKEREWWIQTGWECETKV